MSRKEWDDMVNKGKDVNRDAQKATELKPALQRNRSSISIKVDQLAHPSDDVRYSAISDLQQEGIHSFDSLKEIIRSCSGKSYDITSRVAVNIVPVFYKYYGNELIEFLKQALVDKDSSIRQIAEIVFMPHILGKYKDLGSVAIEPEPTTNGFSCHKCNNPLLKSEMMSEMLGVDAYEGLRCVNCGKIICLKCNPKNNNQCPDCGGSLKAIF
jgi:hypothetical protein